MLLLLGFFVSKLGLFLPLHSFIFPFLACPVYPADECMKFTFRQKMTRMWLVCGAENVNKYISLNYCGVHMDGFGRILPVLCILGFFFPVTVTVIQLLIVKEGKIRASVTHLSERCCNMGQSQCVNVRSKGGLWNECSFQFAGWSYCLSELKRVPKSGFLLTMSPAPWFITAAHEVFYRGAECLAL